MSDTGEQECGESAVEVIVGAGSPDQAGQSCQDLEPFAGVSERDLLELAGFKTNGLDAVGLI